MRTRTCRSRSWWRRCSRSATWPHAAVPGDVRRSRTRPAAALELPGLTLRAAGAGARRRPKFDLTLDVHGDAGGLRRRAWNTTPTCSTRRTVARMAAHLRVLLEGSRRRARGRASPSCRCSPRPSGSSCWSSGTRPRATCPARTRCMHALFEAQVRRTPDAVAAASRRRARSPTRELNARANQLARHLRALGVGPEVRVGLCLERSLEMWSRCSASSRPAAPTCRWIRRYPAERLALMLEDARAPVLVTQRRAGVLLARCGAPRAVAGRDAVASRGGARRAARGAGAPGGSAGLRDLHLGHHRPAQGRRWCATAAVSTRRPARCGRRTACRPGSRVLQFAVVTLRRLGAGRCFWPLCAGAALVRGAARGADRREAPLASVLREQARHRVHADALGAGAAAEPGARLERLRDAGHLRRRGAARRELVRGAGARAGACCQHLRPHGDHGLRHASRRRRRTRGAVAHRPADRQHAGLRAGRARCSRCPWACRASCTSAAWAWRGATWAARS